MGVVLNRTIRILLVDCDIEFRNKLVTELAQEGIFSELAATRQEVLHQLKTLAGQYELVLVGQLEHSEEQKEIIFDVRRQYQNVDIITLTSAEEAWQSDWTADRPVYCTADRQADRKILAHTIRSAVWYRSERLRSQTLQSLRSVAEQVGVPRSEEALYQHLYEEASALLPGLDGFMIAQYDEQADEVSFPFAYKHDRRIHIQSRKGGNSLAEYVLLTKKPLLLPYGDEMIRMQMGLNAPDPNLGYSRSEIVVPMYLDDGKIYGVVFASTDNPNIHYTLAHLQLLTTFTREAASTIRSFIQIKEANQLRDATAALAGQRGREGVLRAIVEGAHKIVNSSFTGLILLGEDGKLHKASPVIPEDFFDTFEEARQAGGLTRAVVEMRRPLKIPDTSTNQLVKESVRNAGIKSMLVLPLIHGDRVLGVLYTHTLTFRDFTARDMALWTAFATQAAGALDRVIEEERKIQDYQKLVLELGNLEEHLSLKETLVRVASVAKTIFDSDTCRLFYIDPITGKVVDSAWAEDDVIEYHIERNPRPSGSTYHVLHTKKPFYYPDMRDGPSPRKEILDAGLKSAASLPLRYGARDIGVLHCLYFTHPAIFNEHYQTLMEAFGARAAVAVNRAAREDKAKIWHDLDREIVKCSDVRQLYQLFTQRANDALGADFSVFYPYDVTSSDKKRLPLADECVRVGTFRAPWRPPKGGTRGGVFREVAHRESLMIVNELKDQIKKFSSRLARREGVRAFVAMRLEVILPETMEPNLAGILFVNFRQPASLKSADLISLRSASELIAAGILRLSLQDKLQRAFEEKNKQLRAVIEIFRTYENDSTGLNLDHITKHAALALGFDACTILEFDASTRKFTGRGNYGLLHPEYMAVTPRSKFEELYMHQNGPVVVTDVRSDPFMKTSKFVRRERIRSTVVYPLWAEGESLGLIFANYRQPKKPTLEELKTLGLIADVTGLVLHRAQLKSEVNEIQQKEERRRLLVWVSMVEDMWQHTLVLKASSIRNNAYALLRRLQHHPRLPAAMESVPDILADMYQQAGDIANAPPRVPLESEMTKELIPIGALLMEFAERERTSNRLRGDTIHNIDVELKKLGGVQVYGYRRWLIYAFESIFQNAYKAMPKGGQIIIRACRQRQWVEIRIQDTGKGVPRNLREQIFKQPMTGKRKHSGLGIGSVLATTLMEETGGSIELEKPGPGDTTVLLRLPIAKQAKKK
jgi:GAF domain-containing protein